MMIPGRDKKLWCRCKAEAEVVSGQNMVQRDALDRLSALSISPPCEIHVQRFDGHNHKHKQHRDSDDVYHDFTVSSRITKLIDINRNHGRRRN